MKRIVILQHTDMEIPGTLLEWTKSRGHKGIIHPVYKNQNMPTQDSFDWLIVLGGSMNVDQEKEHPWLKIEKKFIAETLKHNKSYLGICLGGQMLAQVLGAKVTRSPHEEIGWHKVIRNEENHHAFQLWPKELHVFHWHEDRFSLPSGAKALAKSDATEFQAYCYGKNIVGLQFHPESTENWIFESYKNMDESKYQNEPYVQNFETVRKHTEKHLSAMTENFFRLLDNMEKNIKR